MADPSLQLPDDERFLRRNWGVQRVGWGVMILLVAATLLGALGRGPLSKGTRQGDGFVVEWDRVTRHESPAELRIVVPPPIDGPPEREVVLSLSHDFLEAVELESIIPGPVESSATADEVFFVLRGARAPMRVRVSFRPQAIGLRDARVSLDGRPTTDLSPCGSSLRGSTFHSYS